MTITANPVAGRAFQGIGGEERAYRMGLWLRAKLFDDQRAKDKCERISQLARLDKAVPFYANEKAAAVNLNTAGGFLVPDELEKEILSLRDLAGVYRKLARVLPIGSDSRSWPRRTGGLTASWTAENAATSGSSATFDEIRFNAKKLAGLVLLSSEIYEDETVGLAAWVAEELAWSFADQEDAAAFNGDGTATYMGIKGLTKLAIDGSHNAGKYTAAGGHNTYALVDYNDTAGFMGLVPNYAIPNATLVANHVGFANTLWKLAQQSGALSSQVVNGEVIWYYLGIPIRLTPKLPSSTSSITGQCMMLLGDFRLGAAIAQRRGVTIRRSEDRYLDTDQIGVIGTERVDIVNFGMGDNTTAGPIVSLVAP